MGDFERLYDFNERLGRHFAGMRRAVEVCTVRNYSFDLSEDDERRLNGQWEGIVRKAVKGGKEIIQIQLCDAPVEEEMRAYLAEAAAYFGKLGEKLLVIPQDEFERMSMGWDLTDQFWVIDGKTAIVSSFAEDGELLGDEIICDAKASREIAELSERALAASLTPNEFVRRYC